MKRNADNNVMNESRKKYLLMKLKNNKKSKR